MDNRKLVDKDLNKNKHAKPKESSSINKLISIFRKRKMVKKSKVQTEADTELQTLEKAECKENIPQTAFNSENNRNPGRNETAVTDELCENFSGKILSTPLQHRGRGKRPLHSSVNMPSSPKSASSSPKREIRRAFGRGRGLDIYRKTHARPGTLPPLSDTEQEDVEPTHPQPDHKYFFIMKQPSVPVKQFLQGPATYSSRLADSCCLAGPKFIQYVVDSYSPTTHTCSPTMPSLLRL